MSATRAIQWPDKPGSYAVVSLKSKDMMKHIKENHLIYDADTAQAVFDAVALAMIRTGCISAYFTLTSAHFVICDGIINQLNSPPFSIVSRITSTFVGALSRKLDRAEPPQFIADMHYFWLPIEVKNFIKMHQGAAEDAFAKLAANKMAGNQKVDTHGLTKFLKKGGSEYDGVPHVYRRGICIHKDRETKQIQQVISLEPYLFIESLLEMEERKQYA